MPLYRDEAGCLVLDFHAGDIAVSVNRESDTSPPDEVSFSPGPAGDVGRPWNPPEGATTASSGAVVRMVFRRPESLRVVIEELQSLRPGGEPAPDGRDPKLDAGEAIAGRYPR